MTKPITIELTKNDKSQYFKGIVLYSDMFLGSKWLIEMIEGVGDIMPQVLDLESYKSPADLFKRLVDVAKQNRCDLHIENVDEMIKDI